MAITVEDCDRIIEALQESDRKLTVISQLREKPDIIRAKEIIESYGANLILTPKENGMNGTINLVQKIIDKDSEYYFPDCVGKLYIGWRNGLFRCAFDFVLCSIYSLFQQFTDRYCQDGQHP